MPHSSLQAFGAGLYQDDQSRSGQSPEDSVDMTDVTLSGLSVISSQTIILYTAVQKSFVQCERYLGCLKHARSFGLGLPMAGAHVEEASSKDGCSLDMGAQLQLGIGGRVAGGNMEEQHLGDGRIG